MLILLSFPSGFHEPSLSPFCTKAMLLLQMAGVDWRPQWTSNPGKAPLGKLPALRREDGVLPDSNLILDWLDRQGAPMFPDDADRGDAHLIMRLAETSLYHGIVYDRWARAEGWGRAKPVFFAPVPAALRSLVAGLARRKVLGQLKAQGIAAFSDPDRLTYLRADLDALSAHLGAHPWMLGNRPSAADASILPMLSTLDHLPDDTALRGALRRDARLMDYVARGRAQLYAPLMAHIGA